MINFFISHAIFIAHSSLQFKLAPDEHDVILFVINTTARYINSKIFIEFWFSCFIF